MPAHITRRDLPRTAWIQSAAFAATATHADETTLKHPTHPQRWACAAWPGYLLRQAVTGHRNIYYTPSRDGIVAMHRAPHVGAHARLAAVAAFLPSVALLSSLLVSDPLTPVAFTLLAFTLLVLGVYLACFASLTVATRFSGRRSRAPKGTPKLPIPRQHVTFETAATHPDAPAGGTFAHANDLMATLPSGTTVVVHPRTETLREYYQRSGFQPSKGLPMVKVIP